MPPRDEPTVESELMSFGDSPTTESPALKPTDSRDRISSKLKSTKADQTAEVSIDDLGLDLDQLEETERRSICHLAARGDRSSGGRADHGGGSDERSRRMMAEAESRARDRDLTELERELEASFVADLGTDHEEIKTAVLGPDRRPRCRCRAGFRCPASTRASNRPNIRTSRTGRGRCRFHLELRGLSGDSIDLDLDRLANALGSGDTVEQPRADDEVFSTEVFEASQRNRRVDLDVGEAMNGTEAPTNKLQAITRPRAPPRSRPKISRSRNWSR